jgi:branched-subunit amino acid transport protein
MLTSTALTLMILALAAGTYLLRLLPITLLSGTRLPDWLHDWLSLVPGAVLAASLAQTLFVPDGQFDFSWRNIYLLAAVPAVLVAWRSRNVLLTMLSGMAAFAVLQRLLL